MSLGNFKVSEEALDEMEQFLGYRPTRLELELRLLEFLSDSHDTTNA
jgi:hypothetical protein